MAVAIQTRYLGPTNHRGSRVVAEVMEKRWHSERRERVTVPWDNALDVADNHRSALCVLLLKLGDEAQDRARESGLTIDSGCTWRGIWGEPDRWVGGGTDTGYVWVYVNRPTADTMAA